jgi:hypothetical protein
VNSPLSEISVGWSEVALHRVIHVSRSFDHGMIERGCGDVVFDRARGLYLGELGLKRRHSSLLARVMEPDAIHCLAGAE